MTDQPFAQKLITKEEAAELLSVSKRTINNWIADGTMPKPVTVGRRIYWHPETFGTWQKSLFVTEPKQSADLPKAKPGRPRARA